MPKTKKPVASLLILFLVSALWPQLYIVAQAPAPAGDPSPESVVVVPDEKKLKFLEDNSLKNSDLQPVPHLIDTYVVPVPTNKLTTNTEDVTINPRREYRALLTPNDPIYSQYYTDKIGAPAAWDTSTGSSNVTVAVIDTGFGLDHEDLTGRWATNSAEIGATVVEGPAPNCTSQLLLLNKNCNNFDDDSNGLVDDWRGWDFAQNDNNPNAGSTNPTGSGVSHGTSTAGLVGATGNNSKGVASINWGARILPLQILDDNGSGFTDDLVAAINYAVTRQVKVINLSLGSAGIDPLVEQAITNAVNSGATVVAAAGNCGDSNFAIQGCTTQGQILYPAKYNTTIAVGATDANDARAAFSSYGPEIDLVAPGSGAIYTPVWRASNGTSGYSSSANGTSFAAPIVAGTAASILGLNANLTPTQIRQLLVTHADKVAGMNGQNFTNEYGYGRLNAFKTVKFANSPACTENEQPEPEVFRLYNPTNFMHMYTPYSCEVNVASQQSGYTYEGVAFYQASASGAGTILVHRLYNPNTFIHFWATTQAEINIATQQAGYIYEGPAYYAASPNTSAPGAVPIHRLYNPRTFLHLWTAYQADIDAATASGGYVYEGVAFYAFLNAQ